MNFRTSFAAFAGVIMGSMMMSSRPISVQERYIEQYKYLAIEEMERTGIPASIKMAQALFESQSGRSELATQANNHFGIKCKNNWSGETYLYKDDDRDSTGNLVFSCFRSYSSVMESYLDHSEFLKNRSRYKELFDLPATDYKAWALGLKRCGYATDPNYSDRLIRTIEKYNLDLLDQKAHLVKTELPENPENTAKTEVTESLATSIQPVELKHLPLKGSYKKNLEKKTGNKAKKKKKKRIV